MRAAPAPVDTALKSPEAFRTISEVATDISLPQHVLRFWETRFAQIRPIKRAGGRRYYRPEDVALLRGIRSLLYQDGYTIKGAQKILREQGVRYVMEMGNRLFHTRARCLSTDVETEDNPRFARAAIARLQSAHSAGVPSGERLEEMTRPVLERLEALLRELIDMKAQLRRARDRPVVP